MSIYVDEFLVSVNNN